MRRVTKIIDCEAMKVEEKDAVFFSEQNSLVNGVWEVEYMELLRVPFENIVEVGIYELDKLLVVYEEEIK